MWNAGGEPIVNAICELRPGEWDASEGEVSNGVLVMRPTKRRRRCCNDELYCVVEVENGTLTWGLWRCRHCERSYSIGPKLPGGWVGRLADICIELYCDYQAAVAAAYGLEM
jgi:hypothetical protein